MPVARASEQELLAALDALGDGSEGPFAAVPGTHFGRFAFVPGLPDPAGKPMAAEGSFLLMCADFDDPIGTWTSALCSRADSQLDSVLGFCVGYPGSSDPAAVAEYFVRHNASPGFTVAGYRPVRVDEVRSALSLAGGLRELAVRAQAEGLKGAALRRAWREAVGG